MQNPSGRLEVDGQFGSRSAHCSWRVEHDHCEGAERRRALVIARRAIHDVRDVLRNRLRRQRELLRVPQEMRSMNAACEGAGRKRFSGPRTSTSM